MKVTTEYNILFTLKLNYLKYSIISSKIHCKYYSAKFSLFNVFMVK